MRSSDWSSDVCSSDLIAAADGLHHFEPAPRIARRLGIGDIVADGRERARIGLEPAVADAEQVAHCTPPPARPASRSEKRRVGKGSAGACRSRWSPYHSKKNRKISTIRTQLHRLH